MNAVAVAAGLALLGVAAVTAMRHPRSGVALVLAATGLFAASGVLMVVTGLTMVTWG